MGVITRSAKSRGAKHHHPGGEFGFVLNGAVIVERENEPHITLKAGDSFYQPPGEWHVVSTTPAGAETVVFRVLKKGQSMVVAVD
ncbi:MAG: cupin domain-containing protein [Planctomycetota bacterium]